jgi:response regulator of citrate/malate metabolism
MDVLVVDDDFMVARVHAGFVERTPGFRVAGTARTGQEALDLVAALDPDIVLLDVHLPDISGLQVLQRLRAADSHAAVVMVTAERDVEVVKQALHGGAQQYLVKPFRYDDLAARLDRVRAALETLAAGAADEDAIDQATIDRLFAGGSPHDGSTAGGRAPLPKGLSEVTAEVVLTALRDGGEQSASEVADAAGVSRVTARRYLEHFAAQGAAQVRLNYGGSGRPEHLYRVSEG